MLQGKTPSSIISFKQQDTYMSDEIKQHMLNGLQNIFSFLFPLKMKIEDI